MQNTGTLDDLILEWKRHLSRQTAIGARDIDELEDHLRSQIDTLSQAGLDDEEAFLVAVKRIGNLDSVSHEYANEYSERLWKQLTSPKNRTESSMLGGNPETIVVLVLASLAAMAIKIPELFGRPFGEDSQIPFYAHNIGLFVFPFLAGYYVWKRGFEIKSVSVLIALFAIAAIVINLLPFIPEGHTEVLAIIHLPIALWFAVGLAYTGHGWQSHEHRMNFIRFSGEWFIYYVLIALGGAVLVGFVMFIFDAIGLNAENLAVSWVIPCGMMGVVIIAAWLVEAKQNIIENMAPVLAKIFTPLFILLLLSFLITMVITGRGINVEREVLIGFDLLLVIVLGMLLYSISARDLSEPSGFFDLLQLVLVVSAILVDVLALLAVVKRISEYGFSPNKVTALGLNFILIVNLIWTAVLLARFQFRQSTFYHTARWQTVYVPVYAIWAVFVVIVIPIVFRFQ